MLVGLAFGLGACSLLPLPTTRVAAVTTTAPLPSPPPWAAPSDPLPGLATIGIQGYLQEHYDSHVHVHLDVYYEGRPVPLPGGLGIDPGGAYIAPLHTHVPTGVVHVQASGGKTYTLGQLFTLWGVPLDGAHVYDQGRPVGDPANWVLQGNHEIVVAFGTPPAEIPVDYDRWHCVQLGICE
jgi:hypothetical protein